MSAVAALSTWCTFAVVCVIALGSRIDDYPFRNTSLDWDSRVDDLVSRLTLQVRYNVLRDFCGQFSEVIYEIFALNEHSKFCFEYQHLICLTVICNFAVVLGAYLMYSV